MRHGWKLQTIILYRVTSDLLFISHAKRWFKFSLLAFFSFIKNFAYYWTLKVHHTSCPCYSKVLTRVSPQQNHRNLWRFSLLTDGAVMLTVDDPSCSALSSVIWQSHSNDNNDTHSQCRYSDPIIKYQECHWGWGHLIDLNILVLSIMMDKIHI